MDTSSILVISTIKIYIFEIIYYLLYILVRKVCYYEKTHLDKDILVPNNKMYSPDTCIFVPGTINQLFQGHKKNHRGLPEGIVKDGNKYYIKKRNFILKKYICISFNALEDAIIEYDNMTKKYIIEVANYYKKYIPNKLYERLLDYGK